jgi:SAM-dependent methyltransferase
MLCINVGCGQSPTPGWANFDGSPTVRLAQHPMIARAISPLLDARQREYLAYCRTHGIRYGNAMRLPIKDYDAAVVYASHMLEHLYPEEARAFLSEARRVLMSGGVLRLALPDLRSLVERYEATGDADAFIGASLLGRNRPSPLQSFRLAFGGDRGHKWMYDARSLVRLVSDAGFYGVEVMPAGATRIPHPGALNLRERAEETVYVEAWR